MRVLRLFACLAVGVALSGCSVERHYLSNEARNRVIRVESGDRYYLDLPVNAKEGGRWRATCDDSDVDVTLSRRVGKTEVEIRVHRGYDGPSCVQFDYFERNCRLAARSFAITLYKRTGDVAFWE